MCQICLRNPCLRGCPNQVDRKVAVCSECGENICEGEEIICIDDSFYCESCISGMSTKEIVELFGGTVKIAEIPDVCDDYEDCDEE